MIMVALVLVGILTVAIIQQQRRTMRRLQEAPEEKPGPTRRQNRY